MSPITGLWPGLVAEQQASETENRPRSMEQILESMSDVLFPENSGNRKLEINSVGYDGYTPLHVIAWRRDADGIMTLIDAGADVNTLGEMDETPLHIAITNTRIDIAELLLSTGADVNIKM